MPADLEFYQLLARLRRDNVPCAPATVVDVTGSTSGRLGDKALFSPEGRRGGKAMPLSAIADQTHRTT